jgi:hypothetical protein
MIIISKSMIALSALMSAGIIAAVDMSGTQAGDQSAVEQVAQRFPVSSEMFTPVSMTHFVAQKLAAAQPVADGSKGDKLQMAESCAREDWPYISRQCLVSTDGGPVRKVSRVITIERRVGDNASELMRVPVADLAQR